MSLPMYLWTDVYLPNTQFDGFYSCSVLRSLSNIGRCPANVHIIRSSTRWRMYWLRLQTMSLKAHRRYLRGNNGARNRGPKTKCRICRNRLYRVDSFHCQSVFSDKQMLIFFQPYIGKHVHRVLHLY